MYLKSNLFHISWRKEVEDGNADESDLDFDHKVISNNNYMAFKRDRTRLVRDYWYILIWKIYHGQFN